MYCGLGFLQGLTGGAALAGGAKSTAGLIAKKSVLQLSRKELRKAAVQAVGKATIGGILDGAAFSVAEQLFTTGDVRKLDWKQVRDEAILSGATALVFSSVTGILSYRLQVRRSKTPAGSMSKTDRAQYEEFLKRENMEAADGDGIAKAAKTGEGRSGSVGRPTEAQGFSDKGYNPQPEERTLEGYVKQNASQEISLHTNSAGFNCNSGDVGGDFKRFGAESHGGVSPHVHQPQRNVSPNGNTYGSVGTKTANGGVTLPTKKDVRQLYEYLTNGKYR